jgi:pimeloyl-ACP methyl ester carboxylesterase
MTDLLIKHVLERQGCPIHFWDGGQPGRPLVVLTHGLCVDHHSFDLHIPAIAEKYRVMAWDVRGHGLSQPAGEPFTVPLAVEDLQAILTVMGYQQAAFVGHSNGTYISQELAFCSPEQVQALVIADGTCITWEHSAFENWLVRIAPKMMKLYPYETLKKASLPYLSASKEVQAYAYAAYSMLSKADFIALNAGMAQALHAEPDYRVAAPLLLVHGAEDRMGDIARIAPQWAAREPNCQYEVIPNARHFAILDQPEQFTNLVLAFLEKWIPG